MSSRQEYLEAVCEDLREQFNAAVSVIAREHGLEEAIRLVSNELQTHREKRDAEATPRPAHG